MLAKVHIGDCIEVMHSEFEENSIDAIVTDPPYGLEFMGKSWDKLDGLDGSSVCEVGDEEILKKGANAYSRSRVRYGKTPGIAMRSWHEKWLTEALRVLKPGGYIISFSASRTYHNLACAAEDVGFEIRDQFLWVYGSGFPKSRNLEQDFDELKGYGTAVKPAHEPMLFARKPHTGVSTGQNMMDRRVGGLRIDGCRVGDEVFEDSKPQKVDDDSVGTFKTKKGRVVKGRLGRLGRFPCNLFIDDYQRGVLDGQRPDELPGRFFYCPKPTVAEKDLGLNDLEKVHGSEVTGRKPGSAGATGGDQFAGRTESERANIHPTVKPVDLMRYLITLVTMPDATILDPFLGSGTTGCGAALTDCASFHGIERETNFAEICKDRIDYWIRKVSLDKKGMTPEEADSGQLGLF